MFSQFVRKKIADRPSNHFLGPSWANRRGTVPEDRGGGVELNQARRVVGSDPGHLPAIDAEHHLLRSFRMTNSYMMLRLAIYS